MTEVKPNPAELKKDTALQTVTLQKPVSALADGKEVILKEVHIRPPKTEFYLSVGEYVQTTFVDMPSGNRTVHSQKDMRVWKKYICHMCDITEDVLLSLDFFDFRIIEEHVETILSPSQAPITTE